MAVMTTVVSPAGAVSVAAMAARFVENGAGTYNADFNIPAGATLLDIVVEAEALWTAASSAVIDVGDVVDPDGFFSAVNLKATDLVAGESMSIGSTQVRGADDGAYLAIGAVTHVTRGFSSAARKITATVTSVGVGTGGRTRVSVFYSVGSPTVITQ